MALHPRGKGEEAKVLRGPEFVGFCEGYELGQAPLQ